VTLVKQGFIPIAQGNNTTSLPHLSPPGSHLAGHGWRRAVLSHPRDCTAGWPVPKRLDVTRPVSIGKSQHLVRQSLPPVGDTSWKPFTPSTMVSPALVSDAK
jgi:hypothetical protein